MTRNNWCSAARRGVAGLTATLIVGSMATGVLAGTASAATTTPVCTMTGSAGLAAGNGARVDVLDTVAQVLPTAAQHGAGGATACSPRNAFASFQLQISATTASLSGVSLSASGLTGPGGAAIPSTDVRLYREDYVTLTTMSDGEFASQLPRDANGHCTAADCRFPDALIPDVDTLFQQKRNAFPFTVPNHENRVVWADVLIPAGQTSGTYTGSITMNQSTGPATAVPVTVTVVNATLPGTSSSDSAFFLSLGAVATGSQYGSEYAKYAELGLDDRISVVSNNPLGASDLTTYVQPLLKGTDQTGQFTGMALSGQSAHLAGAALTDFPLKPGWGSTNYATYKSFFTAAGQTSKAWLYCDETQPATCASQYAAATTSTAWPGLRLLATDTPESGWPDPRSAVTPAGLSPQGVIPLVQYLDPASGENPYKAMGVGNRMPSYSSWRAAAAGRQVWTYTSCMSGGCTEPYNVDNSASGNLYGWPSYGIDQSATEQQAMGWQMFIYGLNGEEYWDTMSDPNIWTDPYDTGSGNGVNGDGTLFYPYSLSRVGGTTPTPIESIRLKRIRDGRQDQEMLKLATAAGFDAAALAKATFPAMDASSIASTTLDSAEASLMGVFGVLPNPTTPAGPIGSHDLDCNGTPDFLAVQAGTGNLLFYPRTTTDWTPAAPVTVATGFGGVYTKLLLAGDLNGDGKPDLLGQRSDGSLWLMAGNCTGRFGAAVATGTIASNPTAVGDFNGDGIPDLEDQHSGGTLWLLAGTGRGTFAPATQNGSGWGGFTITGVGDANGDGHNDILARQPNGSTLLYEGDGRGGWNAATVNGGLRVTTSLPTASIPQVIAAGDLSGDGKADIEAIDSAGHMTRYNGDGAGNFAATGTVVGNGWVASVLSDIAY